MSAFATVDDVQARLGEQFDEVETAQVLVMLDDVSALVRARRPLIDSWIAGGSVSSTIVTAVCCQVVARMLTTASTGGVGLRSETHPEYAYTLTDAAASGLMLTDSELDLLTPQVSRSRPFSIKPG